MLVLELLLKVCLHELPVFEFLVNSFGKFLFRLLFNYPRRKLGKRRFWRVNQVLSKGFQLM